MGEVTALDRRGGSSLAPTSRICLSGIWPGLTGIHADADACWYDGAPVTDWAPLLGWLQEDQLAKNRLQEVDGAFALAWVDADGALNLARDALGHRSLYWSRQTDGSVVFGSRLDDVVARRRMPARIHLPAVATYLAYAYVPGIETLWEDIFAVDAGTRLRFTSDGRLETHVFWSLSASPLEAEPEDVLRQALRLELEAEVGRCLPDGPVAASLSGGIDSSLVVALMRRLSRHPITALSVSFGPDRPNELEFSGAVAAHCGVRHQVVEISPEHIQKRFDAAVRTLSEPNGDPLTVPNYLLFEAASASTDVMLNGEGGDPCFGGPKNAPMLLAELYGGSAAREASYLRAHQRCYEDLGEMLRPQVPAGHLEPWLHRWFVDPRWPTFLDRLMAMNILFKGAWHILPKVEHLAAPFGVRARSPLFSRRVVTLSTRLPAALKRSGAIEKYLLKEAVRDLLPQAIVDRPKSGMMVPVEAWFSGPLLPMARERLLDGLVRYDLVEKKWLENLLDRRLGGLRPRRGIKIWLLMTLEAHIRGVLECAR